MGFIPPPIPTGNVKYDRERLDKWVAEGQRSRAIMSAVVIAAVALLVLVILISIFLKKP